MSRISGRINLLKLNGIIKIMKGQFGDVECLVIPIEKNKLIKGSKGVYLDIIAFEFQSKKEGSKDTHIVKQSFSKDIRDAMSQEAINALPIIGGLKEWKGSEPVPVIGPDDDLPF